MSNSQTLPVKMNYQLFIVVLLVSLTNALYVSVSDIQANMTKTQTFEAAFQGKCDDKTPCQQLCIELHDGTYECSCYDNYELSLDGYTCNHIDSISLLMNQTLKNQNNTTKIEYRNVLYESAAVISANLDEPALNSTTLETEFCSINCGPNAFCYNDYFTQEQYCVCKLGFFGIFCDQEKRINVAKFNGNNWMRFAIDKNLTTDYLNIELEIRPESSEGMLLLLNFDSNITQNFCIVFLKSSIAHFWFPNGSIIGKIRSNEKVALRHWNLIRVFCYKSFVQFQLNDDIITTNLNNQWKQISGKSVLYIGGIIEDFKRKLNQIDKEETAIIEGLVGCIKHFRFNELKFLFNRADDDFFAVEGLFIDECIDETCVNNDLCQNTGLCKLMNNEHTGQQQQKCICHYGNYGENCQYVPDSHVLSFNYDSFIIKKQLTHFFNRTTTRKNSIEIDFYINPQQLSGSILYALPYSTFFYQRTFEKQFFALFLDNGFPELIYRTNSNLFRLRSNQSLSLDNWHHITIYQNPQIIYIQINKTQPYILINDEILFTPKKLIFGRVEPTSPNFLNYLYSFKGSLKNVRLNNMPLIKHASNDNATLQDLCIKNCQGRDTNHENDLATCHCGRNVSANKQNKSTVFVPRFQMTRNSYIFINKSELLRELQSDNYQISLRLKTSSINGLVLFYNYHGWFLSLEIIDRFLVIRVNVNDGFLIAQSNSFEISDNLWHRLKINRQKNNIQIAIDNKIMTTKQSLSLMTNFKISDWYSAIGLYVGGLRFSSLYQSLDGCVFDVIFNSYVSVPLMTESHEIAYCIDY